MPPIKLTDSELDAVMSAARPIAPERRDAQWPFDFPR
jgi:hypothetical protein